MSLPRIPFFERALETAKTTPEPLAVVDLRTGLQHTYGDLLRDVSSFMGKVGAGESDIKSARVIGLVPNGYSWVVAQWACWASGGLFVPILHTLPLPEMEHIVRKSQADRIIVCETQTSSPLQLGLVKTIIPIPLNFPPSASSTLPTICTEPFDLSRNAFMLFTSGSTGHPKGVPMTHAALASQASSMSEVWKWSSKDRILHVLPMHHIHGVVNVLLTALYNGATCEFMPKFSAPDIWDRFLSTTQPPLSLFMAVPTIYSRLLDIQASFDASKLDEAKDALSKLRLMVSGSASLPAEIKKRWAAIGGGVLLERYGMTETGMIISCGLDVSSRVDGHVGYPMPGVQVRLLSESNEDVTDLFDTPGEVQVKGTNIFRGYWDDEVTTAKEFVVDEKTGDRWFKTGDIALRETPEQGGFKILGRNSVDIIKSGGEKISALSLELSLLSLPNRPILDCAVVGVPSAAWGQAVGAAIVLSKDWEGEGGKGTMSVKELRALLRDELAPWKLPQFVKIYEDAIPRNQMGKVNKKELLKIAFSEEVAASS
ncbi:putative long-chain acyl-CoA synthetase [Mrakia frigida]|uniref:acyl-CoA synthetase n=1 Tax=Mrakia frigida TaxID=29902 RepID=UPI003FCC196E